MKNNNNIKNPLSNNSGQSSISKGSKFSKFYYKNKIRKSNPNIFYFNIDSVFIYECRYCLFHYKNLIDYNKMKPVQEEINKLKSVIDTCAPKETDNNFVYINPSFYSIIKNIKRIEPKKDESAATIKRIILNNQQHGHISIRKITEIFNDFAKKNEEKTISKSKVHRIIKNVLKLSYRKTNIKTNKLIDDLTLKYSFFFLKVFIRALKLNLIPIYIDEAGFTNENNNLYCWREKEQEIYTDINKVEKFNLLLGVSPNKIINYSIEDKTVDSSCFTKFMEEVIKSVGENFVKLF